jgi:hypothetical protein
VKYQRKSRFSLFFRDAAYPFPTVGRLPVAFRAELKDNFFRMQKNICIKKLFCQCAQNIFKGRTDTTDSTDFLFAGE